LVSLEDLTNTRIPGPQGSEIEILAHVATPSNYDDLIKNSSKKALPVLIVIHEFFGLSQSIVDKANGLANDLGCVVIAPDTFRGTVTDFIPKAIWLALSTPQDRVNDDLNSICSYIECGMLNMNSFEGQNNNYKLAIMGFCYGGGKAIRYTTECRNDAATIVFYGSPLVAVNQLKNLKAPVCGVYGRNDAQFPMKLLSEFKEALTEAKVDNDVQIYDGVGHAFWTDMEEVKQGSQPQKAAYIQSTNFLRRFYGRDQ
jgi:carboxymethylenebutenolidase